MCTYFASNITAIMTLICIYTFFEIYYPFFRLFNIFKNIKT